MRHTILDGIIGKVSGRRYLMSQTPLKEIVDYMYSEIGSDQNEDVSWYLYERPKDITRESFFKQLIWAVWVAGKSRKAADSFLNRATEYGFVWDFEVIASWDREHLLSFVRALHGWSMSGRRPLRRPIPEQALKRWSAVHQVAKRLASYKTEEDFRNDWFGGKTKSTMLDKADIGYLINRGIPYVGEPSASFIIRNMGGEAIKRDRWIDAFIRWYSLTQQSLEEELLQENIPLGLFDIVLWIYCEKYVQLVDRLPEHFFTIFDY